MAEVAKDKTIKQVHEVFWARFKAKCVIKQITVTQGFMEAVTLWLEKD